MNSRPARLLAAASVGLALACFALAAVLWRPSGADAAQAAQQRWEAIATPRYRLQIEEVYRRSYLEARCAQDVDVEGELVVTVRQNSCPTPPQTVTSLFLQLQDLEPVRCITFGCACDFVGEPRAEYDTRLGHPRRINIRWATVPNWRHPDYWRAAWQLRSPPRCTPANTAVDRTLTVTLTPIP
ncbi:MAG: hypothetical protein RLZZ387_4722 [Chloroflexota bacterium]|jgi:hypothetical protein